MDTSIGGLLPDGSRVPAPPPAGCPFESVLVAAAAGTEPEASAKEDTQLRSWWNLLRGGGHHLVLWFPEPGLESDRVHRLSPLVEGLGHASEVIPLPAAEPDDASLATRLAGHIDTLIRRHATCAQVLVWYGPGTALRLEGLRHHFAILYGNPAHPEEGFLARYLHRAPGVPPARSSGAPRPRFSIVIPTRNNPECLEQNLRTCLTQRIADFEIVVGDNSDPGDTRTEALIRRLDSERIHHFRTDRVLDLADSFEFAHARARGDYVLGLGSDDGVLFHGLETLSATLDQAGEEIDALCFDFLYYGWPNAQPKRFQNFIRIPPSILRHPGGPRLTWHDSRETLEGFAKQDIPFYDIPNGYGYSILSRRLLHRIIRHTGRMFPGNCQDVHTGAYVLTLCPRFAHLHCPITAFASSGASIGSRNTYAGDQGQRVRHALDMPRSGALGSIPPAALSKPDVEGRDPSTDPLTSPGPYGWPALESCNFYSDQTVYLTALLDAVNRKLLPADTRHRIDWQRYFTLCTSFLYENDPTIGTKREEIIARVRLRASPDLDAWLDQSPLMDPAFRGFPPPVPQERFQYGLLPNGVLYLDGADFGVTNVFEAAELFQRICHL